MNLYHLNHKSSKYAVVSNDHRSIRLRNWDGVYYWWSNGGGYPAGSGEWQKIPKETVPFIEDNVKKYDSEWFDSEQEAEEFDQYKKDLKKVWELWDTPEGSEEHKEMIGLFDKCYEYEEKHYPIEGEND